MLEKIEKKSIYLKKGQELFEWLETEAQRGLTTTTLVTAVEAVEDIVAFASKQNALSVVATHFLARIAFPPALGCTARPRLAWTYIHRQAHCQLLDTSFSTNVEEKERERERKRENEDNDAVRGINSELNLTVQSVKVNSTQVSFARVKKEI